MEDEVLARLQQMLGSLSKAEASVARVVLADPQRAIAASGTELARAAGVSDASVVRLARSVGFAGLPELRIALAQELSRHALELEQSDIGEGELNATDPLAQLIAKVAFHEARAIERTARLVDQEALDRVAQAIAASGVVASFGVGASGLAAADFAQKLQRIGIGCQFSPDTHVQLVHAALARPGAVAVGFSFGGATAEVHHALRLARQAGALTVAVTGAPSSAIGTAAEVVLLTSARETPLRVGALASRMAQLAVVDFLFLRVAQLRFDDLETALEQTRLAVEAQRL